MNPFRVLRPHNVQAAIDHNVASPEGALIRAGGTDLLPRIKDGLSRPATLIDITRVHPDERAGLTSITTDASGALRIGALTTLDELARASLARPGVSALQTAAAQAATPTIRRMATCGGNLLQRPRCWYYRHPELECFKTGGGECLAKTGDHRYHAIFGGGPSWVVHPSSLAGPLVATDSRVEIRGPSGTRQLAVRDLFVTPDEDPSREHRLAAGEVLTAIIVPAAALGARTGYAAARAKASHDWPLAEVSVRLPAPGATKDTDAALVLGHVAPVPWLAASATAALRKEVPSSASDIKAIADLAVEGAQPLPGNRYKVALTHGLVRDALHTLLGIES